MLHTKDNKIAYYCRECKERFLIDRERYDYIVEKQKGVINEPKRKTRKN